MTRRFFNCGALTAIACSAALVGCGAGGTTPASLNPANPSGNSLAANPGGAAAATTRIMQLSASDLASLEVSLPAPTPAEAAQSDVPAVAPVSDFIPFSTRFVVINGIRFAGDHVLVKFQAAAGNTAIQDLIARNHLQVFGYLHGIQWYVLGVPSNADVVMLAQSLHANPLVEHAGLDPMIPPTQVVSS